MKVIKNVRHVGVNGVILKNGERAIQEIRIKPYIDEEFLGTVGGTLPMPWAKDLHNTATGAPTGDYVADARWGHYDLTLTTDNEAEAAQLTFGNQLLIPAEVGLVFETHIIPRVAVPAAAGTQLFWIGLGDNHTNAEDALSATRVGFSIAGGADLKVDVDDNTTDNTDVDTTVDLVVGTRVGLRIEVRSLSEVAFWTSDAAAGVGDNWIKRTTASISALAANTLWQPQFIVGKTSGAAALSFDIEHCHVYHDDDR